MLSITNWPGAEIKHDSNRWLEMPEWPGSWAMWDCASKAPLISESVESPTTVKRRAELFDSILEDARIRLGIPSFLGSNDAFGHSQ